MKKLVLIIMAVVISASFVFVSEAFDVPAPPDSKLDQTKPLIFGGRKLSATGYVSTANVLAIVEFYKAHFMEEGFKLIVDKYLADTPNRQLRFAKGPQEVDIFLVPIADGTTQVGILPHYQGPGVQPFDKTFPSFKDTVFHEPQSKMPTEDVPGEEIPLVPRLPDSVRIKSQVYNSGAIMGIYVVPMKVSEVVDYYKETMPNYNWNLDNEVSANKAPKGVESIASLIPKIPNVFTDGENLGEVISNSAVLHYSGQWGRVTITVFMNFISRDQGSMVQVVYRER